MHFLGDILDMNLPDSFCFCMLHENVFSNSHQHFYSNLCSQRHIHWQEVFSHFSWLFLKITFRLSWASELVFPELVLALPLEDIAGKLDIAQYGGKRGSGPEHMVVALMDRILGLLDKNTTRSAVIKTGANWDSAFDRGDPTTTIQKNFRMVLRPSLVSLLQDFLSGRTCTVLLMLALTNNSCHPIPAKLSQGLIPYQSGLFLITWNWTPKNPAMRPCKISCTYGCHLGSILEYH